MSCEALGVFIKSPCCDCILAIIVLLLPKYELFMISGLILSLGAILVGRLLVPGLEDVVVTLRDFSHIEYGLII